MMKAVKTQAQLTAETNRKANLIAVAMLLCLAGMPEIAMAAGGNPIQNFLEGVINFFNTGVMRSVGILAVISMGVAAYLGRISWELAMKVGGGIILTFGASALVDQFSAYV